MKKIALIICEYNPFHNGHSYQIEETRRQGAETIICLMSGNFVQRGELAFCEKSLRAEMAVRCGADLVLELPLPYVLSGAHYFAEGAAKLASALGVEATLSFGAGGTLRQLFALRNTLDAPRSAAEITKLCETAHYSYPRSVQTVLEQALDPAAVSLLKEPNSLLALEYLRAFGEIAPNVDFYAVRRKNGVAHDSMAPEGSFSSAKYLRALFSDNAPSLALTETAPYVPSCVCDLISESLQEGKLPLRRDLFSAVAMTRLLSLNAEQLQKTNGVRHGIENRILAAVQNENDLYALFDAVKSKRYTHAGIRQMVLSAVLGVTREDLTGNLPYLRVLGMNAAGRAFLRERKGRISCPVIMNLSEAPLCRLRTLDETAGRLVALCRSIKRRDDTEYQVKPFVLEE